MKLRTKTSGFILIGVYLILFILVVLVISLTSRGIKEVGLASRQNKNLRAFYLAEAGVDHALEWIRANPSSAGSDFNSGDLGGGTSFAYNLLRVLTSPYEVYKVVSTGKVSSAGEGNIEKSLTATLIEDHYVRYAYFSGSEQYQGSNVWFIDGDVLKGPVQTNGRFNLKGAPVFEGEVKSASSVLRFYNNGSPFDTSAVSNPPYDIPDFQQGIQLGAATTPLPATALDLRNAASGSQGLLLTGETTIVFNANGTINVTNSNAGWSNYNTPIPDNGAIFVDDSAGGGMGGRWGGGQSGTLYISGTINGSVSVGSSANVYITNNIVYSDDPRVNSNSTDKLGIIAEENVIISDSAPYNLQIHASIMALTTSFTVENYWVGPAKGTLTVYGGIIQANRGPVGTFSGSTGEKLSGYSKDYQYDSRLETSPPPYSPTTGDYIMVAWQEEPQ